MTPPGSQASLGGQWNYFQDGSDCDGPSFQALTMDVADLGGGALQIALVDGVDAFVFDGAVGESNLVLGGTATSGGVTLEIPAADWAISQNRNELSGPLTLTRTEGGVACTFTGDVEIFRTDATQTSVIRGDWEWDARTASATGGCVGVGEVQTFDVTLWPKRQNQFFVELIEPGGEWLQFSGSLSGATLTLSGTDTFSGGGTMTLLAGSRLSFASSGGSGTGTLNVALDGAAVCSYSAQLTAARPASGEPMLPVLRDVEGQQEIMGLLPDDLSTTVSFVSSLGSTQLGAGSSPAEVEDLFEVFARRSLDASNPGTWTATRDALVFTRGGDIEWLDLAQRFDANGERVVPAPVRVFEGNGQDIEFLEVYGDLTGATTVIVGHRANDRFMIELQTVSEASASVLLTVFTDIAGMLLDDSGHYAGMAAWAANTQELRRLSVDQASELIATGVLEAEVTQGGSLYYSRIGELSVLEAGAAAPVTLEATATLTYRIGRPAGETMFMGREQSGIGTVLSHSAGGALEVLATSTDVSGAGPGFSELVPVGDRLLFTFSDSGGTRRLAFVPTAGGIFTTISPTGGVANYAPAGAVVMNDQAYFSAVPFVGPSVFGVQPQSQVTEELAGFRVGPALLAEPASLATGTMLDAITLLGESGEVRFLRRGNPSNPALAAADLLFTSSAPNAGLYAATYGTTLIVADESDSVASDPSSALYSIDLSGAPGAPQLFLNTPGEYSLPLH